MEEHNAKIRAAGILGIEAFDLDTGTCIGLVKDVVIDPSDRVSYLGIKPKDWYRGGFAVSVADLKSAGQSRANFRDPERTPFSELTGRENLLASRGEPMSRAVVSASGANLGILTDYSFAIPPAEEPGRLVEAVTRLNGRDLLFRIDRVVSLGEDALVIEADSRHGEQIKQIEQHDEEEERQKLERVADPNEESPARAFEERKFKWLKGRAAPREITGPDGEIIVKEGSELSHEVLKKLGEHDLLNALFFEVTLLTSPGEEPQEDNRQAVDQSETEQPEEPQGA